MGYSAAQVKDLRGRTGAGFADCKKALESADGDMQKAMEWLRSHGTAVAGKKAGRETGEGRIAFAARGSRGCLVEVLTETDFVASNDQLAKFARSAADALAATGTAPEGLGALKVDNGESVEDMRLAAIAKIGENIQFGRHRVLDATSALFHYVHHNHRIGVIADVDCGNDPQLGADICMHIAAFQPQVMSPGDFDEGELARLRGDFAKEATGGGKDAATQERIVEGKLRKHVGERALLTQGFIKDDKTTVERHLRSCGGKVVSFTALVLGKG